MGHGDDAHIRNALGRRDCAGKACKLCCHHGNCGDPKPFEFELVNDQPGGAAASITLRADNQIGFELESFAAISCLRSGYGILLPSRVSLPVFYYLHTFNLLREKVAYLAQKDVSIMFVIPVEQDCLVFKRLTMWLYRKWFQLDCSFRVHELPQVLSAHSHLLLFVKMIWKSLPFEKLACSLI